MVDLATSGAGSCIHHVFTSKHQPYRLRALCRSSSQPCIHVTVLLCSVCVAVCCVAEAGADVP